MAFVYTISFFFPLAIHILFRIYLITKQYFMTNDGKLIQDM